MRGNKVKLSKNDNLNCYNEIKEIVQNFRDHKIPINRIGSTIIIQNEKDELAKAILTPLEKHLKNLSRKDVEVIYDGTGDFEFLFSTLESLNIPKKINLSISVDVSLNDIFYVYYGLGKFGDKEVFLRVSPLSKGFNLEEKNKFTEQAIKILNNLGYKQKTIESLFCISG
ncbi:MAG: hypothetical protein KGH65_02075 [Candidatus Micrarchaeota archaeon]|nr:hypothetical protein [Candidatus Micrarchaeota archaeon]